ncbi:MAG TPA: CYCXC family (seleno)protein [Terriglobales bacterium]|nr:CYCXC family (seleno)protein [Terriglobales bacterium]
MRRIPSILLICLLTVAGTAQWKQPQAGDVPAYHESAPKPPEKMPPLLPAARRVGPSFQHPSQRHGYELAEKIQKVIYQQPCYCFCDRSVGHKSLHSCFESDHGAHCATCLKEVYYAYQMTKAGKTPEQVREGIKKGLFEQIDLQTAASIN